MRTLFVAFNLPKTSRVLCFLLCNHPLHYLRLILRSLNAPYKRYTLLLVYIFRESHCYHSLSFSTSKNMRGYLFVVSVLLNTLFGLFSGIFICKYVTRLYIAAVKRLNRPDTVSLLVCKCRKS